LFLLNDCDIKIFPKLACNGLSKWLKHRKLHFHIRNSITVLFWAITQHEL